MTNNDILRRIRYSFDLRDTEMIDIFALAGLETSKEQVATWLKKEEDEGYIELIDRELATFLNGFIIFKRGERDGDQPVAEDHLNNNMVFKKLRIALDLKAEDILDMMQLADFRLSKHELSAFFRKPDNKNFRECKDQILRNFLLGIQRHLRPDQADSE